MMLRFTAILCASLALGMGVVHAETPGDGQGRFTLAPVEGGFMRLDKESGAVAFCARKNEQWSCDPVEDKTRAIDDKIAKLEAENKTLKDHLRTLEAAQPPVDQGPPPGSGADGKMQLPTEEEVDKALDYVERMFKKFRDRLQKLDPPKTDMPPEGGRL
jgi:hypothetical protein